jgi:hypothetical protein
MTLLVSSCLFPARLIQNLKYRRKIRRTQITQDPIFIIGVWRTGTTFLNYLMTLDNQFGFQSNFMTYVPHASINPGKLIRKLAITFLPKTRPMDNVKLSLDKPGEEEFPIALESQLSFYHSWFFPKRLDYFAKYLTFNDCNESKIKRWKKRYYRHLKKLTYVNNGKQLLLKNPPNTARIKILTELFPNAKFIYLYREPYTLYSSTIHLYRKLLPNFSYQKWDDEKIQQKILDIFSIIQEEYESSKTKLSTDQLIEIRYDALINKPLETLESIYKKFNLVGFKEITPVFKNYINNQRSYKKNKHNINVNIITAVNKKWGNYRDNYGFEKLET